MLIDIPPTTQDLFTELQKRVVKLPEEDRNAFVIDLMKFLTDWQFAYIAFINQREIEENTDDTQRRSPKGVF